MISNRNNFVRRVLSVFSAAVMVLSFPLCVSAGNDATVQSYEEQLANVAYHIRQAENELESIRNKEYQTWTEISKLDELISYNDSLKELTQKQLEAINGQIIETESTIAELEEKISGQQDLFLERMASSYMEEETDYLELIFGAEDLVDFLSKVEYVSSILEQDKQIIKNLEENKNLLNAEKEKLADSKETQALRVADYEKAISDSQATYEEKQRVMEQLAYDENASLNTYTYYKDLENSLNSELENYLAELQRKSQSAYVGGTGGWPLQAGVFYYVSSEFGWRVLWGANDYHLGIDLACANGTEIYAYNAGTVLKSEWHDSYGNYVLVDHGGGISTLYAHMSSRAVQAGDYVAAGQLLGYVGMTGSASGYHLHFETRENGTVVNPRNYLYFP